MSEDFPEKTHVEVQGEEVEAPQTEHKAERMDESAEAFHSRMGQLMAEGRDIFVFRGAGTKNGIAVEDVPGAVDKIMANLQTSLDAGRKVAIMFDGDEDNREKPDVGAVFGLVADLVKDNENVAAIAAQQESWYYPDTEGGDLKSATGTPYETFVFPDSTPGGHASLTQSKDLAQYENYKQFFVGPAGAIAGDQLRDLNEKAQGRPEDKKVEVIAIATHNNGNLSQEFEEKAKAADESGDTAKADGFRATLKQREEQPYGMMYGADSYKSFLPSEYPNVKIDFDESLVSEFQEMREVPLKDTYETDSELAHTKAHVLNDSEGQDQVNYLLGNKLETRGYNMHPRSSQESRIEELPSPYYTLAARDLLKALDRDPRYLDEAVEKQKEEVLKQIITLRGSEEVDDTEYAAQIKRYSSPGFIYKETINDLIDKGVADYYRRHRSMDG